MSATERFPKIALDCAASDKTQNIVSHAVLQRVGCREVVHANHARGGTCHKVFLKSQSSLVICHGPKNDDACQTSRHTRRGVVPKTMTRAFV